MKTPITGMLAVLGASALLAAGCGGSSKATSSTTAAATSAANYQSSTASSTTSPAAGAVRVSTKHDRKLGTILAAGSKKLTVYMFEADKGDSSSCSGACASAWPPLTSSAVPAVSGAAKTAELGTITRSDGTSQVTYDGHPLYYYEGDKDSGDAYGQGSKEFGAEWYVLSPSGKKVDNGDSGSKEGGDES